MYDEFPWNKVGYKSKTKIGEIFWDDFLCAARMLLILDAKMLTREKEIRNWREPDIYSVFDKLRQDYHNELPYNRKFVEEFDRSIEREVARGRYPE